MTDEQQGEIGIRFSSALPVIVYTRPAGRSDLDWEEFDRGPGYFHVPAGQEIGVKIKGIDNRVLKSLAEELRGVGVLRWLDLAENRNVTNEGMTWVGELKSLVVLNLSSCSITSEGLAPLKQLLHLERLNLSFCNRLNDQAVKMIDSIRTLEYVDLQGCPGVTRGAISRVRRRNLTVHS